MRFPYFGLRRRFEQDIAGLRKDIGILKETVEKLPYGKQIDDLESEMRGAMRLEGNGMESLRRDVKSSIEELREKVDELQRQIEEPSKVRDYRSKILGKMLDQKMMGGRHVPIEAVLGGFPIEERKDAERALQELVRKSYVQCKTHGTKGGSSYTLNMNTIPEIKAKLGK